MRVGINAIALLSPLTGIGQYTKCLIRELAREDDIELHFFYARSWSRRVRETPLLGVEHWKRLVKRFVPRPYQVSRAAQQWVFGAGARLRKLDLYHDPNFLAYRFDGPTIVTVHDLSWIRYPQTHPPERVAVLNDLLPETLARAQHVITDAEFVRREVIDAFGIKPGRITAIPLGVREEFRPRDMQECRPTLAERRLSWRRYLLSVGTLEPRKNLRLVLEAYAQLPAGLRALYPLVLVGMRGWGSLELESSLKPLVESGSVRVAGFVSDCELAVLYAAARALVYPSLYEGFGLPPLEAMACGTPVIVSNSSTLPEVVGQAAPIIDPYDPAELCERMRMLVEDDASWERYRAAGLDRASGFSWRRCAQLTADVYRRTLREGA